MTNASGFINNSDWTNLPGTELSIASTCVGQANTYNDWLYWDFGANSCGVEVTVDILDGPQAITDEACTNLFPVEVVFTPPPFLNCEDIIVFSCNAEVVEFSVSPNDPCIADSDITYTIASGSIFNPGSTEVTASATTDDGEVLNCVFNVMVVPPDEDGDGFSDINFPCGSSDDCDDQNAAVNPGAIEVCDGVDNNLSLIHI